MKALFGSGCAFSPSPSVLFFSSFHLFFFTFPPVPSFLVESFFAPVPGSFLRLAPSHLTLRSFKFQLFVSLSPLLPPPQKNAAFYSISRTTAYYLVIIQTASLTFSLFDYRYVLHRTRTGCVSQPGCCSRSKRSTVEKLSPWSHSKFTNPSYTVDEN